MNEGVNKLELASVFCFVLFSWTTKYDIGSYVGDFLESFNQEGKGLNGR